MSKRVELTISTEYVKHWGAMEGVRELMQNALDAEHIRDCKMEVTYEESLLELSIITHGAVLETKTLLLGVSEKGGTDAIGKWGEGYKLAVLALCRSGKSVTIDTGGETWRPRFVKSATFGVPVLAFDIDKVKASERAEQIRVTIGGVTAVEWSDMRSMFAHTQYWRNVRKTVLVDKYSHGRTKLKASVLYDAEQQGRVYVGGIFVMQDPSLRYGYDLPPSMFELDRDRRTIDGWALKSCLSMVWQSVMVDLMEEGNTKTQAFDDVWNFVGQGEADASGVSEANYLSPDFTTGIVSTFTKLHGKDAYPATDIKEEKRARALGLKAIRVPKVIAKVIGRVVPSLEKKEKERESEILSCWSADSLPAFEQEIFARAWQLVSESGNKAFKVSEEGLKSAPEPLVAKFRSSNVLGLHVDDKQIYVSRHLLTREKWGELVVTLAHEWGHHFVSLHGASLLNVIEKIMEVIVQTQVACIVHAVPQEVVVEDAEPAAADADDGGDVDEDYDREQAQQVAHELLV